MEVSSKLAEAERLLADGKKVSEICEVLGISEQTYHRWRKQNGEARSADSKRVKELEAENARLKRLVVDLVLAKHVLEEQLGER
jgi:transposase-like protein